ncbi:MAG: autotransporter domain-containing protein [Methylocystis sp.]
MAAFALAAVGATGAWAQNCTPIAAIGIPGVAPAPNLNPGYSTGLAASTAVSSVINSTNTAFLTQSSAFVGGPTTDSPNQEAGGIWVRGVGGNLTTKNQAGVNAGLFYPGSGGAAGLGLCSSTFYQTYGGYQLGFDIGRFNWSDFNITVGVTAGYIGASGQLNGGNLSGGAFTTSTQAPFVGAYAAATYGNFFADALVRWNYYSTLLSSPSINLFNQKLDARGMTFAASGGYRWIVPNTNYFLEPSLGMIWTYGKIEPLEMSNPVTGIAGFAPGNFQGSTEFSAFNSAIGRLGLRAGTSVEYGDLRLQPFVAASIWHEFGPNLTARYNSCPACLFAGAAPGVLTASISNQTIGTFGQYSIGTAAQIASMPGWLAFVRVDYRNGDRMEGISGTGGVRYQIASLDPAGVLVTKGPAPAVTPAHDWTGFYVGGIGGGAYGYTQSSYAGSIFYSQPQLAGIMFGGTAGYNYQFGHWVVGAEVDGGWTNAQGNAPCAPLIAGGALFQMNCGGKVDWFANFAGRAGYASGQFLYYAKAGAALVENAFSGNCNLGPLNGVNPGGQNCAGPLGLFSNGFATRDSRVGWMAGLGAEFALTANLSAKGEIDYMEFGSRTNRASDGITLLNGNTGFAMAKIGVNYNFSNLY